MTRLRPATVARGYGAAGPSALSRHGAAGAAVVVALALVAGLALRLVRLDQRPMHNDEANQAIKFGGLLDRGEYAYDAFDHHGPTLYYLTLPVAWLRGQTRLAATDEWTLRSLPVAFGAATILLLPLLSGGIGRPAVAAAAVLMAVSPGMVFYSRMYIQESMFACFALGFAIALGRALTDGGWRWPALAGLAAGLAIATKETSAIVIPVSLVACGLASWSLGTARPAVTPPRQQRRTAVLVGLGTCVLVAVLFYSAFLTRPGDLLGPLRAAPTYFERGVDPADHVHPWHYYLSLLGWSSSGGLSWTEALILVLAAVGLVTSWLKADPAQPAAAFWRRYLTANAVLSLAIFSAIPYKTPWNLLPFHAATIVAAGIGFSALARATASRAVPVLLWALLAVGSVHLGWQAWRASVVYAADPRNPYVYSQTVPDAVRMAARIRDLAALHADRDDMLVQVIATPHEQWPLPWYLRKMKQVGYWTTAADVPALDAPVIVASMDNSEAVDAALGDRYVSEFFGVRPDVLVTLYIERGLWERFLARTALGGP
ncbi:MAG: flippase activity-associated protein Agl23 [Vicinamibacteraceae bacterium]